MGQDGEWYRKKYIIGETGIKLQWDIVCISYIYTLYVFIYFILLNDLNNKVIIININWDIFKQIPQQSFAFLLCSSTH